jgi:hypothetical protein
MEVPTINYHLKKVFEDSELEEVLEKNAETPSPVNNDDIGCHVAAMCAQAIEKSIKGYVRSTVPRQLSTIVPLAERER